MKNSIYYLKSKGILKMSVNVPSVFKMPGGFKGSIRGNRPGVLPDGVPQKQKPEVPTIRVILAGDSGTGKTTFVQKCQNGEFNPNIQHSRLVARTVIPVTTEKGKFMLEMLEMPATKSVGVAMGRQSYYKQAKACLVFFDLSNNESFENLKYWIEEIIPHNKNILVCGNKLDLTKTVQTNFREIRDKFSAQYLESSSKSTVECERIVNILTHMAETAVEEKVVEEKKVE